MMNGYRPKFNNRQKQAQTPSKVVAVNHTPSVKSIIQSRQNLQQNILQAKLSSAETPPGNQLKAAQASNTTGMPTLLKNGLETLSGMDLSAIRVHTNSSRPAQFNALAYTLGKNIHLAPGQEKHLAHEGWHVVQQIQGRVKPTVTNSKGSFNEDSGLEREADEMGSKAWSKLNHNPIQTALQRPSVRSHHKLQNTVQFVRPSYVVSHNFLGFNIPVSRGVHPDMRDSLTNVQAELQQQYDALDPATRPATLQDYAGITSIKGWRETTSQHGTGSAVDVNYTDQPYIATRTIEGGQTTYGGERPPSSNTRATKRALRALRQPAVEVYDRAVSFMRTNPLNEDTADVGNRRVGESATDTYRRFDRTSSELSNYLGLVFLQTHTDITRAPAANPETATEADLLAAIPAAERKDETTAVADIQAIMNDESWINLHPGHITAREQYIRILRDYEIVRLPMQYGNPLLAPGHTRNPARGFLHMPEHFVVAMMDIGDLRWGASEFSTTANGDVHHFDLRDPYHSPLPEPENETISDEPATTPDEEVEGTAPTPEIDANAEDLIPLTFNVQTDNLMPKRWANRSNVNAGAADTRTNITISGPPGSTIDITHVRQDAPDYGHTHTNAAGSARERLFKHGHLTNQADGLGQRHNDFQIDGQGNNRTISYHAPHVAGQTQLTAQINGRNDAAAQEQTTVTTEVTGLQEYTTNHPNEILVGQVANHGTNHWGTANTITRMENIVTNFRNEWVAAAPAGTVRNPDDAPTIRINDFSLQHGGVYDYEDNWRNRHQTHRFGNDIDISRRVLINGVSTYLRPGNDDIGALYDILNGVIGADPEDDAHWHVDV